MTSRRERKERDDVLPEVIAREIMSRHHFATVVGGDDILAYESGVYRRGGETVIEDEVEDLVEDSTNSFVSEVKGHIRRQTHHRREEFDADLCEINFANGVFNAVSREFREHDHTHLSRIQLPHKYDPTKRCDRFWKFLYEILPNAKDRCCVLEEIASTFDRSARYQQAYMWYGSGSNGKSALLNLLERILSKDLVSHQSIHDLAYGRFAPAQLDGCLANTYADISDAEIQTTGRVKNIIAGDPIDVERKGKDPYRMAPFAKLFYSANKLPQVADNSDAWMRRWACTEFKVQFIGDKKDANLLDRLTTEDEISGIINVMLAMLPSLIGKGVLPHAPTMDETRATWAEQSNVVQAFINQRLRVVADGYAGTREVYDTYRKWCFDPARGYKPETEKDFHKILEGLIPVKADQIKPGGRSAKTRRVWRGIELPGSTVPRFPPTPLTGENIVEDIGSRGTVERTSEYPFAFTRELPSAYEGRQHPVMPKYSLADFRPFWGRLANGNGSAHRSEQAPKKDEETSEERQH